MASTVETLEAIFQNNECKLDVILCKLEAFFSKYLTDPNTSLPDDQQIINPVKIISELKNVKNDLSQVKQSYQDLQVHQKEFHNELEAEYSALLQEVDKFLQAYSKG